MDMLEGIQRSAANIILPDLENYTTRLEELQLEPL
jgi:hypothetical protein